MFKKDTPLTAKLPLFFVAGELGAWLLIRYYVDLPDVYSPPDSLTAAVFLASMCLFVLFSLCGLVLVVWELLIALKTKEHYWYLYVVALVIIWPWITVLTYRPSVHHCGCVVPSTRAEARAPRQ